jgi:predicted AlkP superfamily phosphohydrolase/phosphomutase
MEFNNLYPAPIRELYRTMDSLLGEVMNILRKDDILFIVSDHGIKSFRRCFNLNTWLNQNGYLTLKEKVKERGDFFANVNWETTRAYGVGLAGLYINQRGREQAGIVNAGEEKQQLKKELQDKLTRLLDEEEGKRPIAGVYDAEEIYSGPYRENGPDLVVGCNDGYRISWESVTGKLADKVFENNTKHWRADHCVDTSLVPGVLFCNRKLGVENPEIIDLAPTILTLFGIDVPAYMDGKAMKVM